MAVEGEALAAGARLNEFTVEEAVGAGGFGVTYLAWDATLERRVAVKEYLPYEWGSRRADGGVGPRSRAHAKDYAWGLARFLEEARVLARFDHPHVVRVHGFFEAGGTAYLVTEYVEGPEGRAWSLADELASRGPLSEPRVRALMAALSSGLSEVHGKGLTHRDIKPANVMLRGDGSPVLIDFGAARQAVGRHTHQMTSVLSPGYAPNEQYYATGVQGPWTDVYALGAVAYECLSGVVPAEAPSRVGRDPLRPLSAASAVPVGAAFASAVDCALSFHAEDRPQTVDAWLRLWSGGSSAPAGVGGGASDEGASASPQRDEGPAGGVGERVSALPPEDGVPPRRWRAYGLAAGMALLLAAAGAAGWLTGVGGLGDAGVSDAESVEAPEAGPDIAVPAGGDSGADAEPGRVPNPDPEPSPEAIEAGLGLDEAARREVQEGLAASGYDPGVADGRFGPETRVAIQSWQRARGRPATGFVDESEVAALQAAARSAARVAEQRRADAERRRLEELRRPGRVFRDDCAGCPELVVVPAGSFMMGSPPSEEGRYGDEGPRHRVTIPSAFAVGVYEVTFSEWDACVSGGGCGGYRPDDEGWGRGTRPVVHVSWEDARSYVAWLSRETGEDYRLLSESEWEYVARGGTTTSRYWGSSWSGQCRNANGADRSAKRVYSDWTTAECDDGMVQTAPVGTYGTNGFGVHDVLGNVWEWVEDCWHGDYGGAPSDGWAWTSGGDCGLRVLRGGSWSVDPRHLRSAYRGRSTAGLRDDNFGFRVSRTLALD